MIQKLKFISWVAAILFSLFLISHYVFHVRMFMLVNQCTLDYLKYGTYAQNDLYGKPLKYSISTSEYARTAIVVSAEKDGEFYTSDDYVGTMRDINKSRIAGELAGEKSKEFFKGWLKDRTKESKFK